MELHFPYVVRTSAHEFSQMPPIFLFTKNPMVSYTVKCINTMKNLFNDINNLAPLHLIPSVKKGIFYERDQKYEKKL